MAVALQRLLTERDVPLLLLRTVMLALARHTALARFVCTNVLPLLIQKAVWRDKRLWEGFAKCCRVGVRLRAPADRARAGRVAPIVARRRR